LTSSPCCPELAGWLGVESLPPEAEAALEVSDRVAGLAGGGAAAGLVFGLVLTRPGSMLGRTRGFTGAAADAELVRAWLVLSEPVALLVDPALPEGADGADAEVDSLAALAVDPEVSALTAADDIPESAVARWSAPFEQAEPMNSRVPASKRPGCRLGV
jgi:hypothetical protein